MSEVGRQVGAVGVSELCGHIRNGERRILPEPLRRLGQSAHPELDRGQDRSIKMQFLDARCGSPQRRLRFSRTRTPI